MEIENVILAPTQLWKDYDPYNEPLRPSYLKFEETENYYEVAAFINGDKYGSIYTRIYVYGYMPKTNKLNSNIIFINDVLDKTFSIDNLKAYADAGYGVFTFDYIGKTKLHHHYTLYPAKVYYANYQNVGEHLNRANPTAKDSAFYVWDKVCMKVISLVKQLRGSDCNITLTGYKTGADIALQVAAIDRRVNAVASFLNLGWKDYRNYPKLATSLHMPIDDERKRWFAGCATESYLKFIKCPTLCVTTSNCSLTSLDRIEDSINILKGNKVNFSLSILPGLSDSVSFRARSLLYGWMSSLTQKQKMPKNPDLELKLDKNGTIIASVNVDKSQDIDDIILNYSFDELDSTLRSWSFKYVENGDMKTSIPVYEETQIVFAYVTVNYKNGVSLSSAQRYITTPEDENIVRLPVKKTRIIFQPNMGIDGWLVEIVGSMFQFYEPQITKGPLDLFGITCERGNLTTYSIGEYRLKSVSQNLLQFDAYSKDKRNLCIEVCSGTYGKYVNYTANVALSTKGWTKYALKLSDFKDENLVPLKSWRDVKKLSFKDTNGVLLTNIIWV
ncbi:MAG: hypothetical protein K5923_00665 [Clostridia bacterium]|nr:hypothetical protein [Clostridia bacterium]